MKQYRTRGSQGAAVITALFIVALVSALVVAMFMQQRIDLNRTEFVITAPQLYWDAQSATQFAEKQLYAYADLPEKKRQLTRLPAILPINTLGESQIQLHLQVLDGLVNLNNLSDPSQGQVFLRLIALLSPETTSDKAQRLLQNIVAQTGPLHHTALPSAKALPSLLSLRDPSLGQEKIKQFPWPSKTCLRSLPDVSATLYNKLAPFIAALPTPSKININYAPAAVLQALAPTISSDQVQHLLALRKEKLFTTVADFEKFDVPQRVTIPSALIATTPAYILITAEVRLRQQRLLLFTVEHLQFAGNKQTSFRIERIWQSQNTL